MNLGAGMAAGGALGVLFRAAGGREHGALLRPPGALPEDDFLAACIRCGQCVEACPHQTLFLAGYLAGVTRGTPTFDPETIPCSLCQGQSGLKCIPACPTGALQPVPNVYAARMGIAAILKDICLAYNSTVCLSCWHACPFPDEAIHLDDRLKPVVNEEVCVGCGLCTRACPAERTAIPIQPVGKIKT